MYPIDLKPVITGMAAEDIWIGPGLSPVSLCKWPWFGATLGSDTAISKMVCSLDFLVVLPVKAQLASSILESNFAGHGAPPGDLV